MAGAGGARATACRAPRDGGRRSAASRPPGRAAPPPSRRDPRAARHRRGRAARPRRPGAVLHDSRLRDVADDRHHRRAQRGHVQRCPLQAVGRPLHQQHHGGRVLHRAVRLPVAGGAGPACALQRGAHVGVLRPVAQTEDRVGQSGAAGVGAQAPAEREPWPVVPVTDVDRHLRGRGRPGHGQLPGERTAAEQHVGDARALGAGQPRRDQRVDLPQLAADDLRPSGDHEHHAGRQRAADRVDGRAVLGLQGQALLLARLPLVGRVEAPLGPADVAEPLGVRRLADHDDADVAAGGRGGGVGAAGHLRARGDRADAGGREGRLLPSRAPARGSGHGRADAAVADRARQHGRGAGPGGRPSTARRPSGRWRTSR